MKSYFEQNTELKYNYKNEFSTKRTDFLRDINTWLLQSRDNENIKNGHMISNLRESILFQLYKKKIQIADKDKFFEDMAYLIYSKCLERIH